LVMLANAGVPVLRTTTPTDFDGIVTNLRRVGRACRLEAEAEVLVAEMQSRLERLRTRGVGLAAWRVCSLQGGLHTYGRGALFDALLQVVGAVNLAAERGAGPYRKLTTEALLAWRPDALVLDGAGADDAAAAAATPPAWLLQMGGIDLLPCVRKGRLVQVPGPLLGSTSHRLVAAAEVVQSALLAWGHP
jgi:ABC-type Fe3+-hydroxamate transport system substrate-binding protein